MTHTPTLPDPVQQVLTHVRICEFSTLAQDGTPITWPVATRWLPDRAQFLLTTTIAFPQKAYNVRRDPRVALYFSDPTGSGLSNPPLVLAQGDARAPDEIVTRPDHSAALADYWREDIFARQPASRVYSHNPFTRWLMDWYYMRIIITVQVQRVLWWPDADPSHAPRQWEVPHVA